MLFRSRTLLRAVTADRFPSLAGSIPPDEQLADWERLEQAIRKIATATSEADAFTVIRGLNPVS